MVVCYCDELLQSAQKPFPKVKKLLRMINMYMMTYHPKQEGSAKDAAENVEVLNNMPTGCESRDT